MALLNKQLLTDLGVEMTDEHLAVLSDHFETTLDERVTNELIAELNDEQVEELTTLRDSSEDQLAEWLKQNVPQMKEIIEDETAILLGELAENSDNL